MRFVDEFRDPDRARALASRIARLSDPRRHYKFMEVCGGHTHTIYKHGIEGISSIIRDTVRMYPRRHRG